MPADTSVLTPFAMKKSYRDFERESEEFALKKQLAQAEVKKAGMLDVDKLGEVAFLKAAMGEQLTPQEEAAARFIDAKSGGISFNPATGEVIQKPRISDKIGLGGIKPQGDADLAALDSMVPPSAPPPDAAITSETMPMLPIKGEPINIPMPNKPPLTLPPEVEALVANNPKARQSAIEEQLKLNAQLQENQINKQIAKPAVTRSYIQARDDLKNIEGAVDRAIALTGGWTAGAGSTLAGIPGTPAKNLQATLNTIGADSAFSTLQTMRDNSKTGGALGAITERELELLRDAKTSLDQAQSSEQLRESLKRYKQIRARALRNVAEAYKADYGVYPDEEMDAAPQGNAPQSIGKQGTFNPKTGKIEWQ